MFLPINVFHPLQDATVDQSIQGRQGDTLGLQVRDATALRTANLKEQHIEHIYKHTHDMHVCAHAWDMTCMIMSKSMDMDMDMHVRDVHVLSCICLRMYVSTLYMSVRYE